MTVKVSSIRGYLIMDIIKDYFTWRIVVWIMLFLGIFILFSCRAADNEGLEQVLIDSKATDDTNNISVTPDNNEPLDEPIKLDTLTFTVDATSREQWSYFSFQSGNIVDIEDPLNSEEWDIGFKLTQVKLNGGVSGPGMGSVVMLTETTFEEVTIAPEDGYRSDSEDTLAIVPQSEKGWYVYTGPPTHWVLPLEDRVFVMKTADGTYAKVRFVGYYKDNEKKEDSGFVTLDYVHQPDGSRNF